MGYHISGSNEFAVSEITVSKCYLDPSIGEEVCAPESTKERDAVMGKWVRVKRDLNLEGSYASGYLVRPPPSVQISLY